MAALVAGGLFISGIAFAQNELAGSASNRGLETGPGAKQQFKITRVTPEYWRVTIDHPPYNIYGPESMPQLNSVVTQIEKDPKLRVAVFDSAVPGFFLTHYDFIPPLELTTRMAPGPTGMPPLPDMLVRLSRSPVVSIVSIRGRATGVGSELSLACDMRFASREKAGCDEAGGAAGPDLPSPGPIHAQGRTAHPAGEAVDTVVLLRGRQHLGTAEKPSGLRGSEAEVVANIAIFESVTPKRIDPKTASTPTADVRHGRRGGRPDVRLLGGYFVFDAPDAALLVSLLPAMIRVRAAARLSVMVQLVAEEANQRRPGRDLVLTRLVEVLLIEALRSTSGQDAPPGLLRGLADTRLAVAMRHIHGDPARSWTVAQLAKKAALSRSAFFERFSRAVGLPPMEYLLAWRMAVAKDLLRRYDFGMAEVAERVGYGSASTFSTAFSRHAGQSPSRYARATIGMP